MASSRLPEDEGEGRTKDFKPDSEDEGWIKLEWTKKDNALLRINDANDSAENGPSTHTRVSDETGDHVEETEESEAATEAEETGNSSSDNRVEIVETHDDSDGISVITDSDQEHRSTNEKFDASWCLRNSICGQLKIWEPQSEALSMQTAINTILVCFVGVLIGLASSRIFSISHDVSPISSTCDLSTVRSESNKLIDQIKELTEVKSILNEIKATMPRSDGRADEEVSVKEENVVKSTEEIHNGSAENESSVLKQLRISLNTLYGALNNVKNADEKLKAKIQSTESILSDLTDLQRIMLGLVKKMENAGRPLEANFWQIANDKMIHVSQSLLDRLSDVLLSSTEQINTKLSKIRCNLNKRLCYLRNTLTEDEELLRELDKDDKFLKLCKTIVNVKCGTHENLKRKKTSKQKDLKNMSNNLKKNVMEKSENIDRPTTNDFIEFFTETSTKKDTCPVFFGPLTYAEVVSGKRPPMLKECQMNDRKTSHAGLQNSIGKNDKLGETEQGADFSKPLNNPLTGHYKTRAKKMKNLKARTKEFIFRESDGNFPRDSEFKKRRKPDESNEYDKDAKNRGNDSAKNSSLFKSKSYVKKYAKPEERMEGEWQFQRRREILRARDREEQRLTDEGDELSTDNTNWYLDWMDFRKNSRSDCRTSNCDADGSENFYGRKKQEKKSKKSRKDYERTVNRPHRKDIFQAKHR